MSLITREIEIQLIPSTIDYYQTKGYKIPKWIDKRGRENVKRGTKIIVKVDDLPKSTKYKVEVKCDGSFCDEYENLSVCWCDYLKCVKEDGKYYCKKCANNLYGNEKYRKTRLKNSISFRQWCIDNNKQDILDRWDYELNKHNPDEVSYSSGQTYYFKCPRGIHESECNRISDFAKGSDGVMYCKKCNSFAQWGVDTYGDDFLEKYWNYEKNNELGIDPYEIAKFSMSVKPYIICQIDKTHNSYPVTSANFIAHESRCPICNEPKGERKIRNWLKENNFEFESQKEFDGLVGLNNGNLSYDFYLPDYNLLIEYQGEFHEYDEEKNIRRTRYLVNNLEKQIEHDRRKYEYAKRNNIELFEIWYYDFEKIEELLNIKFNKKVCY